MHSDVAGAGRTCRAQSDAPRVTFLLCGRKAAKMVCRKCAEPLPDASANVTACILPSAERCALLSLQHHCHGSQHWCCRHSPGRAGDHGHSADVGGAAN